MALGGDSEHGYALWWLLWCLHFWIFLVVGNQTIQSPSAQKEESKAQIHHQQSLDGMASRDQSMLEPSRTFLSFKIPCAKATAPACSEKWLKTSWTKGSSHAAGSQLGQFYCTFRTWQPCCGPARKKRIGGTLRYIVRVDLLTFLGFI